MMCGWSSLFADSVFADWPTCKNVFVTSKLILVVLQSHPVDRAERRTIGVARGHVPAEAGQSEASPPCPSSHTVNTCPKKYHLAIRLSHFVLSAGACAVYLAPKPSPEVLASVGKCEKAAGCLTESRCVPGEPCGQELGRCWLGGRHPCSNSTT